MSDARGIEMESLVREGLLLAVPVVAHVVVREDEGPEVASVDSDRAAGRGRIRREGDALLVWRERDVARRLARKFAKFRHRANRVSLERELDDRALAVFTDRAVEVLLLLVDLEIGCALEILDGLHDLRRARFGVAFQNMKRLFVRRSGVASDDAVDD